MATTFPSRIKGAALTSPNFLVSSLEINPYRDRGIRSPARTFIISEKAFSNESWSRTFKSWMGFPIISSGLYPSILSTEGDILIILKSGSIENITSDIFSKYRRCRSSLCCNAFSACLRSVMSRKLHTRPAILFFRINGQE